jgi:hypothetical protein
VSPLTAPPLWVDGTLLEVQGGSLVGGASPITVGLVQLRAQAGAALQRRRVTCRPRGWRWTLRYTKCAVKAVLLTSASF